MMNKIVQDREIYNLKVELKLLYPYLTDPDVTDIMINPDTSLWVVAHSKTTQVSTVPEEVTERIIIFTASLIGGVVNAENPTLDGIIPLPGITARISAMIPPWSLAPTLCIRKPAKTIYSLADYKKTERLQTSHYKKILDAIKEHKNILISGGTGSGKTTLLNGIIQGIITEYPKERLYIVEDTAEIQCTAENTVSIVVPPEKTTEAVRKSLRFFPDRIIFGELRHGQTCLELLKAWNTGHPGGVTTIHANSADTVLSRLTGLLAETLNNKDLCQNLCDSSVDLIIHMGRGARITGIIENKGENR